MTPDKTPSDSDLQERCAEIVEWQRTGVLPGNALRNYAAKHWAGHTDALQMAERDTSALAMEQIAKSGSPVVAGEPYAYAVYFPDQQTEELVHDLDDLCDDLTNREHTITELYTTPQPTQPQAGAVPLNVDEIEQLIAQWSYELHGDRARYLVRMTENHHGIKEGGQHADR